jgi:rhamnosyltransferase
MGSSTTKPEATVAILTKDAGPGFDSLLAKIDSQTYRRRCDILVIDSGSRDGTVETARRSGARLIHIAPGEFGHGKTRNLAARRAHGRYLCFLSQDARPGNEHWLANLVGACQRTGVAGAYSRQVPRRESSPMERYFLATRYPAVGHVRAPRPGSPLRMADIHFSNRGSCLKRDLLLEHPYREDLPLAEDQCWARDMLLKGHSVVYEPTSCIVHSHDYSLRGVYRKWHLVGRAFSAIGEEESSVRRFLTSGLGYVAKEMGYLVTHRPWWIPYALLYDMLKFAGYRAGKRAARGAQ